VASRADSKPRHLPLQPEGSRSGTGSWRRSSASRAEGNAGSGRAHEFGDAYGVTETGRQTFEEGRANSAASQNFVARLRQKLARIRLRDRDDVISDVIRPKGGYSARFPAVSLP